jgi:gliding motility-associated-like protein
LFAGKALAQPLPCPPTNTTFLTATGDTTICKGNCVPLNVNSTTTLKSTTEYVVSSIPYLPTTYTGGTPILVGNDDIWSGVLQLPFEFCFFGVKYNQCIIGANGQIGFDITLANGGNPWPISGGIPGNNNAGTLNCIMGAYYDIDPSLGGNIRYATYGTAPCRTFVVSWDHVPLFNLSNCPGLIGTQQIVLYETTYAIDVFLESKPLCTNWNSGLSILGIMNAAGTQAYTVPGYNGTTWSATNEGWRFTPDGDPTWTYTVFDSLGAIVGTQQTVGQTASATFTMCPEWSERYAVKGVASSNCDSIIRWDTVRVKVGWQPKLDSISKTDVSGCGMFDGTITLWGGLLPNDTFYIHYRKDGAPQPVVMDIATTDSTVTITGLGAGTYSELFVTTSLGCISDTLGPIDIEDPTPVITNATTTPPSLCRAQDATMTLSGLIPGETYTIFAYSNGFTTTQVLTADANGQVTLTGLLAGVYTVTATLITCTSPPYGPVTILNPAITADFTYVLQPGCTEDVVVFTDNSSGSAFPFEYTWLFGDTSGAMVQNPVHTYENQGTYTVTLMITDSVCRDTTTQDIVINHPLQANFTVDADTICQGSAITFTDASTATGPATYFWDFGNGQTNSLGGPSVTNVYANAGNYIATLIISDFINCKDTAYKYIRVDSLTEIRLSFEDSIICAGEQVKVAATYADSGSTGAMWDFGDGITTTTFGHEIKHSYEHPGIYPIKITATARVCPDVEATLPLTVQPQPIINLGPDTAMCPTSSPIVLNDLINGANPGASWIWKLDNNLLADQHAFNLVVTTPAIYTSVVTIGDCSATDSIWVMNDCYIDVPNSFTPDGDGLNDYFFPRQWLSKGVVAFKLLIFNRWGQEIFSTTNISGRGWDGKFNGIDQPQGVYVYLIEAKFKDNTSEKKQGNVTLLR